MFVVANSVSDGRLRGAVKSDAVPVVPDIDDIFQDWVLEIKDTTKEPETDEAEGETTTTERNPDEVTGGG
eukprot:Skav220093  [mRNA]  locus=scaffold1991:14207:15505:+ [translate_table: standard]